MCARPLEVTVPNFIGDGQVTTTSKHVPEPGPGQLLLEVKANALCGSERSQFERDGSDVTPGHEAAGVVIAAGEGTTTAVGTPGVVVLLAFRFIRIAVMGALGVLYGALVWPVLSLPLLYVLALMYLMYAGIAFVLSASARWDWLSLVAVTVFATFMWGRFGESASPLAKLSVPIASGASHVGGLPGRGEGCAARVVVAVVVRGVWRGVLCRGAGGAAVSPVGDRVIWRPNADSEMVEGFYLAF